MNSDFGYELLHADGSLEIRIKPEETFRSPILRPQPPCAVVKKTNYYGEVHWEELSPKFIEAIAALHAQKKFPHQNPAPQKP